MSKRFVIKKVSPNGNVKVCIDNRTATFSVADLNALLLVSNIARDGVAKDNIQEIINAINNKNMNKK